MANYNLCINNLLHAECTNNLVQIVYEETATESSISCVFLNPFDTSEKLCCIIYGLCHQILQNQSLKCNEHRLSRIVTDSVISGRQYCYSAIAGNATYIVKVEGSFTAGIIIIIHGIKLIRNPNFSRF